MKIGGSAVVPLTVERSYDVLQDPAILAQCMPGTDRLEKVGPDEYEMKMKVVISSISGLFSGKVRIADQHPPTSFKLIVQSNGKIGFVNGEGTLTLAPIDAGSTTVNYDGEVQVGGTIAAIGQRLLDATSKLIIRKFFEKLVEVTGGNAAGA